MTTFDKREKNFEARFVNDADARFRVEMRRDKLVAAWAAEKLGHVGDKAEAYKKEVVRADMEEAGDEDVFRKLRADLPRSVSDAEIRAKMKSCLDEAMTQLASSKDAS